MSMDEQEVSTNTIPRLYGQENYINWKVLFEAAFFYNDVEMWNSINKGPCVSDGTGNKHTVEARMKKKDDRSLAMIKLGLSWEILTSIAHHTTAKAMQHRVEEHEKDRLKSDLDRFKFREGEKLRSILQRFVTIANEIKTTDLAITDYDLTKKLLSSLSGEWYNASKFTKEKTNFPQLKLDDVICFLQAAEHEMTENNMIKEDTPSF
ncbi:uncharacterized protein LOC143605920 [Bidens hawaiensis]|uniref:uncharacterized protein LOC143605920 n=1 Tax=Bidens hawaiensis TaxID=980011 RepID=UPI0040493A68